MLSNDCEALEWNFQIHGSTQRGVLGWLYEFETIQFIVTKIRRMGLHTYLGRRKGGRRKRALGTSPEGSPNVQRSGRGRQSGKENRKGAATEVAERVKNDGAMVANKGRGFEKGGRGQVGQAVLRGQLH